MIAKSVFAVSGQARAPRLALACSSLLLPFLLPGSLPGSDCIVDAAIRAGTAPDCNWNGSPDGADIAAGVSFDCDADGLPDECEPDCNADGEPDDCGLRRGASVDRDGNAIPDECESPAGDCDLNGVADALDLAAGRGDCDGDGLLDACETGPEVLLAADFVGRIGLRSQPGSAIAADLDGDGDLDAAFAGRAACCSPNATPGSIEVVLNLGKGRLIHAGLHALHGDPVAIAADDFEGDRDLDLFAIEGSSTCRFDARAIVLLNRGRGAFDHGPSAPLPAGVESFATGDIDGDGGLDLAIANPADGGGCVLILRSHGGGFAEGQVGPAGGSKAVAAGDWNGDEILDLAATSRTSGVILVFLGEGGGAFAPAREVDDADQVLLDLAASDLDGDRDLDLVAIEEEPHSLSTQLWTFANDGAGGFTTTAGLHIGPRPSSLVIEDADGDGKHDILILQPLVSGEYGRVQGGFLAFRRESDGTLSRLEGNPYSPPSYLGVTRPIAVGGDWNEDGTNDLLVADGERKTAAVLRNSPGRSRFFVQSHVAAGAEALDLVAADLDGDGDPDLAAVDAVQNRLWTGINEGSSIVERPSPVERRQPRALAAGDLDRDGDVDLAVAAPFEVLLIDNAGGGFFPAARSLRVGSNPIDVALSDLDGDGDLDLATANNLSEGLADNATVFRHLEDGRFDSGRNYFTGRGSIGIEAVDMDVDGDADLLISASDTLLLRNDGSAAFSAPESFATGLSFFPAAVSGDADGDRDPDLIAGAGGVFLVRNGGDGRPLEPEKIQADGRRVAKLADIDFDHDLDLLFLHGYGEHWLEVLRNDGRGSFAAALIFDAGQGSPPPLDEAGGGGSGSSPAAAVIAPADLDGDGDLDLALGFTMRSWITIAWNHTRAAEPDVNGDGVPDSCGSPAARFRRADVDQNGETEITDAVKLLRRLFMTGEPLACEKAADADGDGRLNITDAVRILRHLFVQGEPPPAPYPACGPDPTADDLACGSACA